MADPDGFAICASIISTIIKFSRFLIDFGLVYVAEAPIYEQNGKFYFSSDKDQNGQIPGFDQSKPYQRFKGLNTSPLTWQHVFTTSLTAGITQLSQSAS